MSSIGRIVTHGHFHSFPIMSRSKGFLNLISEQELLGIDGGRIVLISRGRGGRTMSNIRRTSIRRVVSRRELDDVRAVKPMFFEGRPIKYATAVMARVCRRGNIRMSPIGTKLLYSTVVSSALVFHSPAYAPLSRDATGGLTRVTKVGVRGLTRTVFGTKDGLGKGATRRVLFLSFGRFAIGSAMFNINRIGSVDRRRLRRVGTAMLPRVRGAERGRDLSVVFFVLAGVVARSSRLVYYNGRSERGVVKTCSLRSGTRGLVLGNIMSHGGRLIPTLMSTLRRWRGLGDCGGFWSGGIEAISMAKSNFRRRERVTGRM